MRRRVVRPAMASMVVVGEGRRGDGNGCGMAKVYAGRVGDYGRDKNAKKGSSAASASPLNVDSGVNA